MAMATDKQFRPLVRRWGVALVGLGLAFLPSWAPSLLRGWGVELPSHLGPASSIAWNIVAVSLLLLYILLVERRGLSSIRIVRPTGKDLEWALILFGIHMGFAWLVRTLWPPPSSDSGSDEIAAMPLILVVALIISAAVFEEILFRGYPLERLTELTHHRWIALVVTVPLFVIPHLMFFGPQWLLYQGSGTLVIYVLYLWRRNLVACMLLHLLINLPILIPAITGRL